MLLRKRVKLNISIRVVPRPVMGCRISEVLKIRAEVIVNLPKDKNTSRWKITFLKETQKNRSKVIITGNQPNLRNKKQQPKYSRSHQN